MVPESTPKPRLRSETKPARLLRTLVAVVDKVVDGVVDGVVTRSTGVARSAS